MEAEGGPARRMTWLGPDVQVRGWTREGEILFVSTYGQPFFRNYRAFTLDPAGGMPKTARAGTGESLVRRSGQRESHRPQHRRSRALEALPRRHGRSSVDRRDRVRDVPADDRARGQSHVPDVDRRARLLRLGCRRHRQSLLVPAGRVRRAAPHGITTTTTSATRRPTASASSINAAPRSICSIRRTAARRAVAIEVPSHRTQAARKFVPAADHLGSFQVHPAGHSLAVDARGKVFAFPLWEGAVRQLGADGARYRLPQWLDDGTTLVAVGDAIARGARRSVGERRRAHAALGHRARRRDARGASRQARRDRQPSQRSADRRHRERRDRR